MEGFLTGTHDDYTPPADSSRKRYRELVSGSASEDPEISAVRRKEQRRAEKRRRKEERALRRSKAALAADYDEKKRERG